MGHRRVLGLVPAQRRAGMIPGTSPLRALLAKERRLLC